MGLGVRVRGGAGALKMFNKFRDNFLLEIVAFTSGALVMVYEIIGSRILAPYIGTSTYVWTSLIGVILGALSLGYWLGGRMADRRPDLKILSAILLLAGGTVSLATLIHAVVLSWIGAASFGLELKSLIAALILFAPPSILFGFVTPYAVRLKLLSVADSGKTVGRLYAISTIGSISGTFTAGFFLLPFVGSVRTLYLIAGLLFALSIMVAPFKLSPANLFLLIIFPLAIAFNETFAYALHQSSELVDIDTEYNRIQVLRSEDKATGRPIRALVTDPFSTQSAMFVDGDDLALPYSHYYHLLRHFNQDFKRTLIIGGAAYSFPKEYLRTYPRKQIDVVEIDPQMTEIARKYFKLQDHPNLRIFHQDGRTFLNHLEAGKYDVILVDAFGTIYSVPFELTTSEAVAKMYDGLSENGVVLLNLVSAIEGKGSLFLQAEYKTYAEKFQNVYVFKVNKDRADDQRQNLILVASKSTNPQLSSNDVEIAKLLENRYEKPISVTVPALTDDLAAVEYYVSFVQGTQH